MVVPATPKPAGTAGSYEAQTQAIAQALLQASREPRSFLAQVREQLRWDDRLLAIAMGHPSLQAQLFRLIDALPSLHSKPEIAQHLQEYLGHDQVELPAALKGLLNFTQPDSLPGQLAASTVAPAVETLAYRYIAGATLPETLKTIERLRRQRLACTIDLLGEAVISEAEATAYLDRYLELITQLSQAAQNWPLIPEIDRPGDEAIPKVQVSVKLTAFYSQFDALNAEGSRDRVSHHIRTLLRRAQELGVGVHFDMEQYRYKTLTLAILQELLMEEEFRQRDDIGLTLQAYLRDSYTDLQQLIQWVQRRGTAVLVRLVKGAYWDQETITASQHGWPSPVYRHKVSTDANFERLTRLLLEHHDVLYAAIASHNARSQAHAIAIAQSLQIPQRRLEFQVLYGMADQLARALAEQGYRVRVYCPYGQLIPGMAYLIRRLLENTANSSFLRQRLENTPATDLLQPPEFAEVDQDDVAPEVPARPTGFQNVPDTDYAIAQHRRAAAVALQTVRQHLGQTYLPLINGQSVVTETSIDSLNPSRPSERVGRVGLASCEQAEQAIAAAQAATAPWQSAPVAQRTALLRRAAELMAARRAELSAWIVLEVGKPLREADSEVSEAIDFCRYYADQMDRLDRGEDYDYPGETNGYRYGGRGITVVISPWNFPLAIATGMTVAALVAGNCTLLKPAEVSSVVAAKLAEILVEAGVPAGVFQYLPAKGSIVGAYLVQHPAVHMIAFTGSREVGCQIYATAAQVQPGQTHLKRVLAEMGGKNAIIVDGSADLDQAVQGVVQSTFSYSGQKCSACSRVIVLDSIYPNFLERLVEATRSLQIGAADHPATQVGPVIDATAQARIQTWIEQGRQEATVALEIPSPDPGYFVGPVIFTDVAPEAQIAQSEIFGPVLAVLRAPDFATALTIANGTDYGLTGGLYSRTPSHIEQAKAAFAVGNVYINRNITGAIVGRHPFGGFKLSGVGSKAGGPDYLLQFLEPRCVSENIQRQGFAPIPGME
jgi:RHH-type proline utilization regulon transcriptional repressor/proline dehydrogenase/delta 1-pyrroline-5-carboxylate dehydrogenase